MTRAKVAIDILGLAGAVALVEGIREIHPPVAWIVGGILAMVFAFFLARADAT
jgi:hypothetical protein